MSSVYVGSGISLDDVTGLFTFRTTVGSFVIGNGTAAGSVASTNVTFTATDKILGRSSAGAGVGEEIACTAGGRALINSAGTADTIPYFSSSNIVTLASITTAGRALLDDADAATQRNTLGASSGIWPSSVGGTGNGFAKLSGPASAEKTFTLPNANDTIACLGQAQTFTANQFVDAALRVRQSGSTRYRGDWLVTAGSVGLNAYDDTGAVYIPMIIEGNPLTLYTHVTGVPVIVQSGGTSQGNLRFGSAGTEYSIYGGADYTAMLFYAAGSERVRITGESNVLIGTTGQPSGGGVPVLVLAQASGNPTGPSSNTAGLVVKDAAGTAELYAWDEAGNVTLISPHAMDGPAWLYDDDDPLPRVVKEENTYLGVVRWTNESRLVRLKEREWSGEEISKLPVEQRTCVHVERVKPEQEWEANQATEKVRVEAERLERAMEVGEVEVSKEYALELVAVKELRGTGKAKKTGKFKLAAGHVVAEEVEEVEEVPTGALRWQLRQRCRFDEVAGKFLRRKTVDEVQIEPYQPKPMPDWLASRIKE